MPRYIFEVETVDRVRGTSHPVEVEAASADRARDIVAQSGSIVGAARLLRAVDDPSPPTRPSAGPDRSGAHAATARPITQSQLSSAVGSGILRAVGFLIAAPIVIAIMFGIGTAIRAAATPDGSPSAAAIAADRARMDAIFDGPDGLPNTADDPTPDQIEAAMVARNAK